MFNFCRIEGPHSQIKDAGIGLPGKPKGKIDFFYLLDSCCHITKETTIEEMGESPSISNRLNQRGADTVFFD